MRTACFAAGLVSVTIAVSAASPALSQTATETLLYLTKREDKTKQEPDPYNIFNINVAVSGNDTRLVMKSVRSGNVLEDLTFRQIDKCRYEISGKRFFNDRTTEGLYTVDFTNLDLDASRRQQDGSAVFFKLVGAKVCTKKGETLGEKTERFPEEGKCTDYLMTVPVYGDAQENKMLRAVRYMNAQFCQGQKRAF